MKKWTLSLTGVIALAMVVDLVAAQPPGGDRRQPGQRGGPPGGEARRPGQRGGPPGGRPGQGPGRGMGMMRPQFPLMVALDANKDGELSAEEIKNAAEALKKIDKNKDGKLDREELRPQFPGRGGPGGQRPGVPGGQRPGGPGGQRPGGPGGGNIVQRIMGMDKNNDGKVTKDEMPEQMRQRILERADTNKDGAIDKQEAEKMAEQIRARGGGGRGGQGGGRGGQGGPPGGRPPRPDRPSQ